MLKKYQGVRYELLRPSQVKDNRERRPIAYIPTGSLEWHGRHNPLGTDGLKAHAICCAAAARHGGIVLPPFYLGMGFGKGGWGPPGWEGYTLGFNEEGMYRQAMAGVCGALVHSGWKVLVGIAGHDIEEQVKPLGDAIRASTDGIHSTGFAMYEGDLHAPGERISFGMDHAGAWETSCMLYVCGDCVDMDELKGCLQAERDEMDASGLEGISGKNPLRYASRETGARIIREMGNLIGRKALAELGKLT